VSAKVREILADLRRRFEALYGPRLVQMVLYGSQARSDAEPGSDIDVLVVLSGEVDPCREIKRTIDGVVAVSSAYDEVVACCFVSEAEYAHERSPLLINVRRDGIRL